MIDVKTTILETIKDKINRMRMLGENHACTLKKVLYLIILDDIYDWSNYLNQNQAIQRKLQELRV